MSRIREKQVLKRKQETLDVAIRIVMERGIGSLNMDELAEEVGISKPTLYQDFESKEELVAHAVLRMFEKMEGYLEVTVDRSPLEQIEFFLEQILRAQFERRPMMGQADGEQMRSIIMRYSFVTDRLVEMHGKLSSIVAQAQERGQIDPALPIWMVVSFMFSLQAVLHKPFLKEQTRLSEEELTSAIAHIIRMFRRSITPEHSEIPVGAPI